MLKRIVHSILNKNLSKGILLIFASFLFISNVFSSYDNFLGNLRQTGIEVDNILENDQISRYELTRLLNAVNCEDCINTPQWMVEKYNNPWRNDFKGLAGKDFDDIGYKGGYYDGEMYYYCVAYVGDNVWMRGYPEGLSPICDGKFCGNRNTTVGEFLQVVLNIADQYSYDRYLTNWSDIQNWMNGLISGSYPDEYLNSADKKLINNYASENRSGAISNEFSMQTYLKYCMFNLEACGMQNFGEVVQGYWPVAELNILYDQSIIEHKEFKNGDIHDLVKGEYVLETLYNLFKLIDCNFDNNYDCDAFDNINDNCPNVYNPSQKDTDGDGIGDVCDGDIDGDGILNPIGIVDELGRIVISKWDDNMDNCLFVNNTNQLDSDEDNIGNICEDSDNYLGMYIKTSELTTTAPLTVHFEAVTQGENRGNIAWNFGDGNYEVGRYVTHTFVNEGLYKISANAVGVNNNAHALTTILVGKNTKDNYAIQIKANKLGGSLPSEIKFEADTKGDFDKFEWDFGNNNIVERFDTKNIIKIFREQNSYMVTLKGIKNKQVVAVANMIIGAGDEEIASKLNVNNLNPNQGQLISFATQVFGFADTDIENVSWNRGDGNINNSDLAYNTHKYDAAGSYVIVQKIALKDGRDLQNFLTINVKNKFLESSYGIETSVNKLIGNNLDDIKFKVNNVSYIPEILLILNRYMDGSTEKYNEDLGNLPKYFDHKYINEGVYFPKTSIFVNECVSLDTIETIAIANDDICLDAKLNNTMHQYSCDLDNDGIADICDDDIDGDGILNLIGIIKFEQENCEINMDNINRDIVSQQNNICALDNCPTVGNKNQMDLNNNGRGDLCDGLYYDNGNGDDGSKGNNKDEIDSDGDGIIDDLDACILIPENYNGIEDYDGCPEIGISENCDLGNTNYNIGNYNRGDNSGGGGDGDGDGDGDGGGNNDACGNGQINPDEDCLSCPEDVGQCSSICGNGILQIGEACDDGNIDNNDGCNSNCQIENIDPFGCGNGIVDPGENCINCPEDVGNCSSSCGNGEAEDGENCINCPEDVPNCGTCGDGNADEAENCETCPQDYGDCTGDCGDGVADPGENCQNCPEDLDICAFSCGNGILQIGEACDDGNTENNDGCNSFCQIESIDPFGCGNGIVDPGENCINCPEDVGSCSSSCGNGEAEDGENCINCPEDVPNCGVCGDENADENESCETCPQDYGDCTGDCGDGVADPGENCQNCPEDLDICTDDGCGNGIINPGENCINCPEDVGNCSSSCGNGEAEDGENCINCPEDVPNCGTCGDGNTDEAENCETCPQDYGDCTGDCGDGAADPGENCQNCPEDLDICADDGCGNDIINPGENCINCPEDVGNCSSSCGNGEAEDGENCINCPEDVPNCGTCGDGNTDEAENCETCPQDYGDCTGDCGDGAADPGENCQNCPEDLDICAFSCGNGILQIGEACDDGNTENNDGCNSFCQIESIDPFGCGNDIIDPGENCVTCPEDVGNCDGECGDGSIDPGEDCLSCPEDIGQCSTCGDGILNFGEACDDGNFSNGDGCNFACQIEQVDPIDCEGAICVIECLSCPCVFSDFANDLVIDDKIQARLWDFDMNTIYSRSIPEPIRQYLE